MALNRLLLAATVSLVLLGAGGAFAADAPKPAPAAQVEPSAKALALTRRYIAAMHMDASMKPMLGGMLEAMTAQRVAGLPDLTDTQRSQLTSALNEATMESLDDGLLTKLMDRMVPGFASVYSEEELQAMVDFYEGPMGQAIVAKMPTLGPIAGKAAVEAMPEMQADLEKRFKAKIEALKFLDK
jgi:hypothetical protein